MALAGRPIGSPNQVQIPVTEAQEVEKSLEGFPNPQSGHHPDYGPIPGEVAAKFLELISFGDSDQRAAYITGIPKFKWARLMKESPAFAVEYNRASANRNSTLALVIRNTMVEQIAKGSSWWTRLAIWNYKVGLRDPDRAIERAGLVDKQALEAAKADLEREARTAAAGPPRPIAKIG